MKKDADEYLLTVLEEGDTFYHYTSAEGLQGIFKWRILDYGKSFSQ